MVQRDQKHAVLTHRDAEHAVIQFDDGQELRLKTQEIPPDVIPGSDLAFRIINKHDEAAERSALAAVLLNELLTS